MKSLPLVTAILPCYNVEKKIERMLESLKSQTYPNIHIVFVDDGSTDETAKMIKSYEMIYEERGFEFEYIYQANRGLGGAVNTGLKRINGEYLIWPDPDDWYAENAVETMVSWLEKHPHIGMVTTNGYVYDQKDATTPMGLLGRDFEKRNADIKNEYIRVLQLNTLFCPGTHMIRIKDFLDVNPQRDIFESRGGQNIQMLLPMYYFKECSYLDVPLYNYVIYQDSLSRGDDSLEKVVERNRGFDEIFHETLLRMSLNENQMDDFSGIYKRRIAVNLFHAAIAYEDCKLMVESYRMIKGTPEDTFKMKIKYWIGKMSMKHRKSSK